MIAWRAVLCAVAGRERTKDVDSLLVVDFVLFAQRSTQLGLRDVRAIGMSHVNDLNTQQRTRRSANRMHRRTRRDAVAARDASPQWHAALR